MSGTSGSLYVASNGASGLPVPKLRTVSGDGSPAQMPLFSTVTPGGYESPTPSNRLHVVAINVPQSLLEDPALGFQLELLRYRKGSARSGANTGSGNKQSAYVHPAHGPAASGTGSGTHGGTMQVDPVLLALRETEWAVTTHGQVVDVTLATHAFMLMRDMVFRETTGTMTSWRGACPSNSARGVIGSNGGASRFPYPKEFSPGYFAFRYSILDPARPEGKPYRVTGPVSHIVSLTSDVYPFTIDAPFVAGSKEYAAATLRGDYTHKATRYWLGSTSRLPR